MQKYQTRVRIGNLVVELIVSVTIVKRQVPEKSLENLKGLHPLLSQLYASRGVEDIAALQTKLSDLHDFSSFSQLDLALNRLYSAFLNQENILIVGDFDADGATSSALAVAALKVFGAKNVDFLVPNRFIDGYGLTPALVEVAAERQPNLIITVDNGVSSVAGVARAKALNIDVIVTDHHLPGENLPEAIAIINPNLKNEKFPSKNLAGVGVIYYLMIALRKFLTEKNWFTVNQLSVPNMADYLDLVALGTVADVVSLDQNNRILVTQGLKRMQAGFLRPGIKALIEISGRDLKSLDAKDLGFAIGPRLNAAGRLDDMSIGIRCLLSQDDNSAKQFALTLDALNKERKNLEADMQVEAFASLKHFNLKAEMIPAGIAIFNENWHQGIVGLLASRIKEKYHRPTIAFAKSSDDILKGSARSIQGIHLRDVLAWIDTQYPGLIEKFGGHAMAAGLSLKKPHFEKFKAIFNQAIAQSVDRNILENKLETDGELPVIYMKLEIAQLLKNAGPWGQGFPEPVFVNQFEILNQRLVAEKHLKLLLKFEDQTLDAIAFNVNVKAWPNFRCQKILVAYRLDINEYQGRMSLQLIVDYLKAI